MVTLQNPERCCYTKQLYDKYMYAQACFRAQNSPPRKQLQTKHRTYARLLQSYEMMGGSCALICTSMGHYLVTIYLDSGAVQLYSTRKRKNRHNRISSSCRIDFSLGLRLFKSKEHRKVSNLRSLPVGHFHCSGRFRVSRTQAIPRPRSLQEQT